MGQVLSVVFVNERPVSHQEGRWALKSDTLVQIPDPPCRDDLGPSPEHQFPLLKSGAANSTGEWPDQQGNGFCQNARL